MRSRARVQRLFSALSICAVLLVTSLALCQDAVLTDDAYVASGSPNANNGATATMLIRGGANVERGFLQFDLSTLPPGTASNQIAKAVLTLYVSTVGTGGSMNVLLVSASWSERTITNNNAPPTGTVIASAVPVSTANKFVSIDITTTLQQWLSGAVPNNGLALVANTSTTFFQVDSKENGTTSHPATLEITLTGPQGPMGPIGPMGPQGVAGPAGPGGPQGPAGPQGAQGPTGATGPTGSVGPAGATGPAGPAGPQGAPGPPINFQGIWSSTTSYNTGAAVFFNGSSYISLVDANLGNQPDISMTQWSLLAQQGATGPAGPQGLTGSIGPQGPTGPPGASGSTGPAGPQGPPGVTYVSTILVSPSGVPSSDGAKLLSAISGSNPSSSSPMLIKVEPGIYDLSGQVLITKPYLDMEGSGEGVTTIIGQVSLASNSEVRDLTVSGVPNAIVIGSTSAARLRHVTAIASGAAVVNRAITISSASNTYLLDVTASASGASSTNRAIDVGSDTGTVLVNVSATASTGDTVQAISFQSSTGPLLRLAAVTATAGTGFGGTIGIFVDNSSLSISQSRIHATTGAFTIAAIQAGSSGSVRIEDSTLISDSYDVTSGSSGVAVFVATSRLENGGNAFFRGPGGFTYTCAAVYDKTFTFSANTCPP